MSVWHFGKKIWKCRVDNILKSADGEELKRRNLSAVVPMEVIFVKYGFLFMILALEKTWKSGMGEIFSLLYRVIKGKGVA